MSSARPVLSLPLLALIFVLPTFPFFLPHPTTSHTSTLSLHDALPISAGDLARSFFSCLGARASRPLFFCCLDRKSTRLNSSHVAISYAVFCLKKKTVPSKASGSLPFDGGLAPSSPELDKTATAV